MISTPNDYPADDDLNTTFRFMLAPSVPIAGVLLGVIAGLPGAGSARPAAS